MRILLTNDDAFFAEGIKILESTLIRYGHEVYVVAPHTEQSAKSHSMTVTGDITLWKHDDRHFSLEGTPADCVIYTLRTMLLPSSKIISNDIDMVISGINHGYNLSSDTIYSGTCAAARQGAMYGYPSIAISTERNEEGLFSMEKPALYLAQKLESFCSLLKGADSFLNLNFPYNWDGEVERASLGVIEYGDEVSVRNKGSKMVLKTVSCAMNPIPSRDEQYPMDYMVTKEGKASATIIKINPNSDIERMKTLPL